MKQIKTILYTMDEFSFQNRRNVEKIASLARLNVPDVVVMIAGKNWFINDFSLKNHGRLEKFKEEIYRQNCGELDHHASNERLEVIASRSDF